MHLPFSDLPLKKCPKKKISLKMLMSVLCYGFLQADFLLLGKVSMRNGFHEPGSAGRKGPPSGCTLEMLDNSRHTEMKERFEISLSVERFTRSTKLKSQKRVQRWIVPCVKKTDFSKAARTRFWRVRFSSTANPPSFSQNSASLAQNSVSSLFRSSALERAFCLFLNSVSMVQDQPHVPSSFSRGELGTPKRGMGVARGGSATTKR